MKRIITIVGSLPLLVSAAHADITVTTGTAVVVKAFQCETTKQCAGSVPIDETGAPLGVSGNPFVVTGTGGTFPATQSGTWTVQPGNTANTTPWLTSISQGGNTAAVNGSGQLSVTCANCSGTGASAADEDAFTAGTSVFAPAGGFFQTTATDNALTNGQQGMWQMTANRAGFVNLRDAAGAEVGTASNPIRFDTTGTTDQPVSISDAGTIATESTLGAISTALTNGAAAATMTGQITTASTNALNIKASAGTLYGLSLVNTTTTIAYARLYDLATTPTCSSATGYVTSLPIPPAAAAGQAGGLNNPVPSVGGAFSTGIGVCVTGGGSSTDNTNAGAGIYLTWYTK